MKKQLLQQLLTLQNEKIAEYKKLLSQSALLTPTDIEELLAESDGEFLDQVATMDRLAGVIGKTRTEMSAVQRLYENLKDNDDISLGALVTIENNGRHIYLMLSVCGGKKLESADGDVIVVTPDAPIALALNGKKKGDTAFALGHDIKIVEVI